MNRARRQFLAGAGFAFDQYRRRQAGQFFDEVQGAFKCGRTAEKGNPIYLLHALYSLTFAADNAEAGPVCPTRSMERTDVTRLGSSVTAAIDEVNLAPEPPLCQLFIHSPPVSIYFPSMPTSGVTRLAE